MDLARFRQRLRGVALVAADLALHPRNIPDYLASQDKQPLDRGLPWIAFGAMRRLEELLRPNMDVFEYGTGGSSVFFAERCRSLVCVEDSADWAMRVRDRLKDARNVNIISQPTDPIRFTQEGTPFDREDFSASDYVHAIDGLRPDVVMIDGTDDWRLSPHRRAICFRHVEPMIKPGAVIVVDDAWAYPEIRANNRAREVASFWGAGPCRRGYTRTDLFFY
jgi:hypothetical protein